MLTWFIAVIGILVVVAVSDLLARRVPNALLLLLIVGHMFVLVRFEYGLFGISWTQSLIGFGIGMAALMPFYFFKIMGAGDVKLFAVLGFLFGFKTLLLFWLIASIFAAIHGLLILVMRRAVVAKPAISYVLLWTGETPLFRQFASWRDGRAGIPYGAYLAIAAACRTLWG